MTPARWSRATYWALLLAIATALAIRSFLYFYLDDLTRGHANTLAPRLIEEATAAYAVALLAPLFLRVVRRFPIDRRTWRRSAPVHVLALVILSVLHTTLNWAGRTLCFRLAGLGAYDYGRMPLRYAMEFPSDALIYVVGLVVVALLTASRLARERERALAEAQLHTLRLRLQPHFLFNALHTVSAVMYEDVDRADAVLEHLATLLRASLSGGDRHVVPLTDELALLDSYVAVMRARFGEALTVCIDVEPANRRARVPSLLLQPLVENAVRHGGITRTGRASIVVRARRVADELWLDVHDDGPGVPPGAAPADGIGLSTTRDRLALLHGAASALDAGNDPAGGYTARVRLPFTT
jgi:signal transduction histidine kinase